MLMKKQQTNFERKVFGKSTLSHFVSNSPILQEKKKIEEKKRTRIVAEIE
jgi:hypothetical protein